jgi:hypothetical protein
MAPFIVSMVLLALIGFAGVAAVLDLTPDSRDPEYGVGPLLQHAARQHRQR